MQLPCRLAASGVDSIPSRLRSRATGIGQADACASAVVPVLLRLLPLRAYARSDAGQGAGINRFSCGKTWGLGLPLVRLLYVRYWPEAVFDNNDPQRSAGGSSDPSSLSAQQSKCIPLLESMKARAVYESPVGAASAALLARAAIDPVISP